MSTSPWILYVKTRCPWCAEAVAYLDAKGFHYKQVDILRDPEAAARMKTISGQTLTPTLVIEEKDLMLPDFDTKQLEKFLQENDLKPV